MRRRPALSITSLIAAIALSGLAPSLAAADGSATTPTAPTTPTTRTTTPTSTTTPAPTPTPTTPASPPAVKVAVRLFVANAFFVHGGAVTVPGRAFSVAGVVRPYVAGQVVTVKTFVGHRRIKSDKLRVKPSRNGRVGLFTETVRSPTAGIVRVKVTHARTRQMLGFLAVRAVAALTPQAGFGSRGLFVDLMQQQLLARHVYLPATGVYDTQMGLAVDAYHRLLGHGTSQQLDRATIGALLNGSGAFLVRHPRDGTHIEGNLSKQLLAEIYGSKVYRIYPISSGKPSTPTILGHFRVYQRTPGYLPDGMYYSSFFFGGYAIHGFNPAPDFPASHGCMRLPIIDAISVFQWLTYGDVVDVYL
ncbi:MAG: L,D-transpeptidase [Solirubrobacteraceae bacterium]